MPLEVYLLIGLAVLWVVAVRYARKKRRESAQNLADLQQRTINYLESVQSKKSTNQNGKN